MIENYEHYISKNIKAFYRRRLFSPILYLVFLAVLWIVFPLSEMRHPDALSSDQTLHAVYEEGNRFVHAKLTDLTFTGYTKTRFGSTIGYYYYCTFGDRVIIVLLNPSTCEQGLPTIDSLSVSCKVVSGGNSYNKLLENLSSDLEWTTNGIANQLNTYYLSQPDYSVGPTLFLFIVYYGTMIYAILSVIAYILYIRFPVLSPTCQNLIVFGSPKKMLEEAEEELATLPQLATEDMFITQHYFIETSQYGNAIVPIREILWIYKYSTLHKFLWYHFSISYTLHISANKHIYIHCPKNIKSDIDGIIDYLSEANHDILVGFNEENRLKVEAVQGKPLHIEKLYAFLRRRV